MADNAQPILWRKRHNLTAWIFQILSAIVYGGFSIYRLMVIISYNENIQS